MDRLITEQEILIRAIAAIEREAGLRLEVVDREVLMPDGRRRIDAIVQLNGTDKRLVVEVKKWASHAHLGSMINQLLSMAESHEGLLVTDYINSNRAEALKHQGIQFIDTVGNAYINQPPVFVYITGNKPTANSLVNKQEKTGRAFSPSGMRVVFAFLKDQGLINAPYRTIAKTAKVALGTVGWVLHDLTAQGFLLEGIKKRQRKLSNVDRLIDKWVEAYPHQLKAKQRLGVFTGNNPQWWKSVNIKPLHALWAGEVAAAQYTQYLNPKNAVVYIDRADVSSFLQSTRLKAVNAHQQPDWRVDLVEPFWTGTMQSIQSMDSVHPLIVYADLIESGDARNIDTANRIREKYLR